MRPLSKKVGTNTADPQPELNPFKDNFVNYAILTQQP